MNMTAERRRHGRGTSAAPRAKISSALDDENLAGWLHDLANVVENVRNSLGLLESHRSDEDRYRGAYSSTAQGVAVITSMLRRMRIILRREPISTTSVDLNAVAQSCVRLLQHQVKSMGVNLETTYTSEPLVVNGTEIALFRVIYNLLLNALQAAGSRRKVALRTAHEERYAVLVVSDSGSGMSDSVLNRAFTGPITTKRGGAGLGLLLSGTTIGEHGGSITVTSRPNQGTSISVRLPFGRGRRQTKYSRSRSIHTTLKRS